MLGPGGNDFTEDNPEGYVWTCCQGRYNAKPCEVGCHVAHPDGHVGAAGMAQATSRTKFHVPTNGSFGAHDFSEEGEEDGETEDEDEEPAPKKRRT